MNPKDELIKHYKKEIPKSQQPEPAKIK